MKERFNCINTLVMGMIVRDFRLLNTVNVSYLEPGYRLPSDRYFMGVIEQKYVDVRESVKLRLQQESAFVSITGDIWTSIATHAYLTLTVQFLSSEWNMCSIVLGTKPLTDQHTGENITIWIEEMLATFSISTDNVSAFVQDSGSNIHPAGQLHDKYGWYTEACAGHTLQLCAKAGLEIRSIEIAIAAARRLVTHFRKSEVATTALRKRQEQMQAEQHNLVQNVATWWNSTYFLIEHLLEQRWPVTAVLSDPSVTKYSDHSLDLTSEQWNLLAELKPVLYVLQVATTFLSAEYSVSISALQPIVHGLTRSMEVMAITELARREMADTEQQQQQQEPTPKKESHSRPKALDLLLGSDSPASSNDSSDPVQDEVESNRNSLLEIHLPSTGGKLTDTDFLC